MPNAADNNTCLGSLSLRNARLPVGPGGGLLVSPETGMNSGRAQMASANLASMNSKQSWGQLRRDRLAWSHRPGGCGSPIICQRIRAHRSDQRTHCNDFCQDCH